MKYCTLGRWRWKGHRKILGRFWPCTNQANSRWESKCTSQKRTLQPHLLWQTMGLQVGFQGRQRWWTSRAQQRQFQAHRAQTRAVGPGRIWEISSISKRGRLTFQRGSLGRHSKQSCTWRLSKRIGFVSIRLWAVLLSRAEPCDSKDNVSY